mmetsp:Transcript_3007/g.5043  ORF Transcript_3007/g.5043 Transcript_3007/m.5043 type:complete len:89 (-) Transcript_3007:21-287(-)
MSRTCGNGQQHTFAVQRGNVISFVKAKPFELGAGRLVEIPMTAQSFDEVESLRAASCVLRNLLGGRWMAVDSFYHGLSTSEQLVLIVY